MRKSNFALLIGDDTSSMESLKSRLKEQSVETWNAPTFEQAARLVDQTQPELIFTQTAVSDGTWLDVVRLAERASAPVDVIVVGSPTTGPLRSAIVNGAFDFISPPFESEPLGRILKAATEDVRHRREELALMAVA